MSDTDDGNSDSSHMSRYVSESGESASEDEASPRPASARPPTPGVALRSTHAPPPEEMGQLNDEETSNFLALVIRNRQITAQLMNDFAEFIDNTQSLLDERGGRLATAEAEYSGESTDDSLEIEAGECDPYSHSYLSGPFDIYTDSVLFEGDSEITLPILVLSEIALVPTQVIPLQFFLPNLIAAMKELLRGSRTFGVIRSHLQVAGTTAEVVSSQLSNSRGIEVLRVKAVGRQCFVMIGREGEDLLTDGLSTVSYSARVRILPDMPSPPYRNQAFGAGAVMTCPCVRRRQARIISRKAADPGGLCFSCQARKQMFPAHVIDRYDEHYQCARIVLQLESLCRTGLEMDGDATELEEAEQMDAFCRMTAALATQLDIGWPLKSFVARLSFDVARTSGPLLFIHWVLRNLPIGSQSDTWRVLHTYETGVEKLTEMWNLLRAGTDLLYCEQCGLEVTSLRHLFSMCRRKIRPGDPFASEYVADRLTGDAEQEPPRRSGGCDDRKISRMSGPAVDRQSPSDEDEEMITIPGDVSVIFVNSFGSVHETLSFRQAINFRAEGSATSDFTWYSGYRWTTIMCRRCFAHLGWKFTKAKRDHYGHGDRSGQNGDRDLGRGYSRSKDRLHSADRWGGELERPDEFFGLTRAALTRDPLLTRPWSTFLYSHEEE